MFTDYKVISWDAPVGNGVTGSKFVTVGGIAKTIVPAAPYCVANEYVANQLASLLHLPTPPGYIQRDDQGMAHFISMNFNPRGTNLPPIFPPLVFAKLPEVAAGVVVFDVLIGNRDRHQSNLAFDQITNHLAVFDHSHSLFGIRPGDGEANLNWLAGVMGIVQEPDPWGYAGNRQCLLDAINRCDLLSKWIAKVSTIPDFFIDDLCEHVTKIGVTDGESAALGVYLKNRRSTLDRLLDRNQSEFRSVVQWKLL